jgi:hypothetical protein
MAIHTPIKGCLSCGKPVKGWADKSIATITAETITIMN